MMFAVGRWKDTNKLPFFETSISLIVCFRRTQEIGHLPHLRACNDQQPREKASAAAPRLLRISVGVDLGTGFAKGADDDRDAPERAEDCGDPSPFPIPS